MNIGVKWGRPDVGGRNESRQAASQGTQIASAPERSGTVGHHGAVQIGRAVGLSRVHSAIEAECLG